jgi:hypothetical protein
LTESGFVVPAPLPGWVILLLEPLTRLPFMTAAIVWWSLLVAAFVALQIQVARSFPSLNATAAFVFLLPLRLWIPVPFGQFVPVCIVLLIGAALFLRAGNDRGAAIMAAAATMEPHIALPVCLALFFARPKTRVPLLLPGAVLAALSIAALGVQQNLEYVQRVLPARIASEANFGDQFSATSFVMALGASRTAAIAIGQTSYWLLAIAAILLARAYAAARRDLELIVFEPMALSVLGGPYVHVEHLLAAIPLALYVVARTEYTRWFVVLAAAAIAWPLRSLLQITRVLHEIVIPLPPPFLGAQNVLAETPWAASVAGLQGSAIDVLTKIPTWCGLIALAGIAFALQKRSTATSHLERKLRSGEVG